MFEILTSPMPIFAEYILSKRLFPSAADAVMKKYVEGSNPKKSSGRHAGKFETVRPSLVSLRQQIFLFRES